MNSASPPREHDTALSEIMEVITEQGFGGLVPVLRTLFNVAMQAERSAYLKAQPHMN